MRFWAVCFFGDGAALVAAYASLIGVAGIRGFRGLAIVIGKA